MHSNAPNLQTSGESDEPQNIQKLVNSARSLRTLMQSDPHRPIYHFVAPASLTINLHRNNKGELQINPVEEIERIRLNAMREDEIVLHFHEDRTLKTNGKSIELKIKISGGVRSSFGVKVFASPDGREETVIRYEPEKEELVIDFAKSSIYGPVSIPVIRLEGQWFTERVMDYVSEQRAPLKLKEGEALELDIFLDRSIIEVFANGRQAMTQIVYPELESSTGIKVFCGTETITFRDIQSWMMAETNAY